MKMVYWNARWQTYETVLENGHILIFRDSLEARSYALEHGLEFSETEVKDEAL